MAYSLYDDNGYLGVGPTIQGLEDLHDWAHDKPVIKKFLMDGTTGDTEGFTKALETATTSDTIEESRQALLAASRISKGPLVLSE
jgi:hypothetical protein